MNIDIITKEDLNTFKTDLLLEIEKLLKSRGTATQNKEWLKSYEVRKLLNISPGTLQQLRVNGTLEYTRLGGIIYFRYEDIIKQMEKYKHKNPVTNREAYMAKVQEQADFRARRTKP